MLALLWLVPALPLSGFLLLLLTGGRLTHRGIASVALGATGLSFLIALIVAGNFLYRPPAGNHYTQHLWQWITTPGFNADIALYLDPLALVMMLVITGVGFLIHLYSAEHMEDEEGYRRYFACLNLFIASMLLLVLADNLLLLFLGWEGVGLCSYLLIGFWYREAANGRAARKAFTVTRIADTALIIGLLLLITQLGTLEIQPLMAQAVTQWPPGSAPVIAAACLLLAGALGKSAQLPFQVWLPDAMAGPAPVSALIHAATMVTAGVYLLIRMHPLFELAPAVQNLIATLGALTALYGASCALAQSHIKRLLAYSTISQVGYMFLAVGAGAYALALFHLMTHACFKSLLFLSSGGVVSALGDEHDMHRMGGLARELPLLHWTFLAGALSLAALPLFSAGFYSKEAILSAVWVTRNGPLLWLVALLAAVLTALYIAQAYLLIFHGRMKRAPLMLGQSPLVAWPLLILAALSLTAGFIELPEGWPGPHLWSAWLAPTLGVAAHPAEVTTYTLQLLSALAALTGIALAPSLVTRQRRGAILPLQNFLASGWRFDILYARLFVTPYRRLASALQSSIETGAIEGGLKWMVRGMTGLARGNLRWIENGVVEGSLRRLVETLRAGHFALSMWHNGLLRRYALAVSGGAVALLGFWLGWG